MRTEDSVTGQRVAPFAGAWIEMLDRKIEAVGADSRSLRGSVD